MVLNPTTTFKLKGENTDENSYDSIVFIWLKRPWKISWTYSFSSKTEIVTFGFNLLVRSHFPRGPRIFNYLWTPCNNYPKPILIDCNNTPNQLLLIPFQRFLLSIGPIPMSQWRTSYDFGIEEDPSIASVKPSPVQHY